MSSVTDVVDSMLGNVEVDMLCNVRKIGLFDLLQDGSMRGLVIYISKGCKRTCCRGMILQLLGVICGCMEHESLLVQGSRRSGVSSLRLTKAVFVGI
jgi:hypothetical protein